jgi:hypothetical protein
MGGFVERSDGRGSINAACGVTSVVSGDGCLCVRRQYPSVTHTFPSPDRGTERPMGVIASGGMNVGVSDVTHVFFFGCTNGHSLGKARILLYDTVVRDSEKRCQLPVVIVSLGWAP